MNSKTRKWTRFGPLFAALMVFALLAPTAMAQSSQKPEKVQIDGIFWDPGAQEFIIDMSALFGPAVAGDTAGFIVTTEMEIDPKDDGVVAVIDPKDAGVVALVDPKDNGVAGGIVSTRPQLIPWDRDGGTVSGEADVTATTTLKSPSGRVLGTSSLTRTLIIG